MVFQIVFMDASLDTGEMTVTKGVIVTKDVTRIMGSVFIIRNVPKENGELIVPSIAIAKVKGAAVVMEFVPLDVNLDTMECTVTIHVAIVIIHFVIQMMASVLPHAKQQHGDLTVMRIATVTMKHIVIGEMDSVTMDVHMGSGVLHAVSYVTVSMEHHAIDRLVPVLHMNVSQDMVALMTHAVKVWIQGFVIFNKIFSCFESNMQSWKLQILLLQKGSNGCNRL